MQRRIIINSVIIVGFILVIINVLIFLKPVIVGYVGHYIAIGTEEITYSDTLDIVTSQNLNYSWFLSTPGDLKSVKLSGSMTPNGSVKAHLEHKGSLYLIFDSSKVDIKEQISGITGFAVLNETLNESVEESNKTVTIDMGYVESSGIESIGGIIDLTVENTKFSWDVDESKLCTRWKVYSEDNDETKVVCYGAEKCCNFINLESSLEGWDETFSLYYNRYGASFNNTISSQVIYVDYNVSPDEPYADVYHSNTVELPAKFYIPTFTFDDVCIETCSLADFKEDSYRLILEVEGSVLTLDNITYTIAEKRRGNRAPEFNATIPNQILEKNGELIIDLNNYVLDEDSDFLGFDYYKVENINISIEDGIAIIRPDNNFTGIRYTFFKVNDSKWVDVSNIITLNVTSDNMFLIEVVQDGFVIKNKQGNIIGNVAVTETDEGFELDITPSITKDPSIPVGYVIADLERVRLKTESSGIISKIITKIKQSFIGTLTGYSVIGGPENKAKVKIKGLKELKKVELIIDEIPEEQIKTQVFAVNESLDMASATLQLPKTDEGIDTIMYCPDFDMKNFSCPEWQPTIIPFTETENLVKFTVKNFTAYAAGINSPYNLTDKNVEISNRFAKIDVHPHTLEVRKNYTIELTQKIEADKLGIAVVSSDELVGEFYFWDGQNWIDKNISELNLGNYYVYYVDNLDFSGVEKRMFTWNHHYRNLLLNGLKKFSIFAYRGDIYTPRNSILLDPWSEVTGCAETADTVYCNDSTFTGNFINTSKNIWIDNAVIDGRTGAYVILNTSGGWIKINGSTIQGFATSTSNGKFEAIANGNIEINGSNIDAYGVTSSTSNGQTGWCNLSTNGNITIYGSTFDCYGSTGQCTDCQPGTSGGSGYSFFYGQNLLINQSTINSYGGAPGGCYPCSNSGGSGYFEAYIPNTIEIDGATTINSYGANANAGGSGHQDSKAYGGNCYANLNSSQILMKGYNVSVINLNFGGGSASNGQTNVNGKSLTQFNAINEIRLDNNVTLNVLYSDTSTNFSRFNYSGNNNLKLLFSGVSIPNTQVSVFCPNKPSDQNLTVLWENYGGKTQNIDFSYCSYKNVTRSEYFAITVRPTSATKISASTFNITANVTNDIGISSVIARIEDPDGTKTNYTMSLLTGSIYNLTYTAAKSGTYTYTILASDIEGNSNNGVSYKDEEKTDYYHDSKTGYYLTDGMSGDNIGLNGSPRMNGSNINTTGWNTTVNGGPFYNTRVTNKGNTTIEMYESGWNYQLDIADNSSFTGKTFFWMTSQHNQLAFNVMFYTDKSNNYYYGWGNCDVTGAGNICVRVANETGSYYWNHGTFGGGNFTVDYTDPSVVKFYRSGSLLRTLSDNTPYSHSLEYLYFYSGTGVGAAGGPYYLAMDDIRVMNNDFPGSENHANGTFTVDITPPAYSNFTNNASTVTKVNGVVNWSINVSDGTGLSGYIFAHNQSGTLENVSNGTISGTSAFVNKTITITASQGNYICGQFWFNDTNNNINQTLLTESGSCFTVANTAPTQPQIVYPEDGKNYSDIPYINYSSTDADSDSITYQIYINNTLNTTIVDANLTDWNASDGYYNLTVTANDGADSSSNSSVVHFRLDTIAPSWSNNETNASSMKINGNATFNITVSDYGSGLSYYIFSWNGTGEGWLNDTNGSISGSSVKLVINKSTNLSYGNVIGYMWHANDSAGNWNNSLLRTFTVANTDITFSNAVNGSPNFRRYENFTANITITDIDDDLSSYIFSTNNSGSWNNDTLVSISGGTYYANSSKNISLAQGNYVCWKYYANDTANSIQASSEYCFTVANTAPATPTVYYPVDGKNYSDIPYINYSSSDIDEDTITYQIYVNGTLNITATVNVTDWNASDGYYNLTVTANDGTDSSANSSVIHFRLDSTVPAFSSQEKNETPAINEYLRMNITITDNNPDSYMFFWNDSGAYTNDTANIYTSGSVISTTKQTTTAHQNICWGYWANDTAGNSASSSLNCFTVENAAPTTPTVTSPYGGETNNTRKIEFYSTDVDNDAITYQVYINNTLNISTTTNITTWNGSDGYYNLTVTANDGINSSSNSSVVHFTLDTTAPTVNIIYPTDALNISSNSIDLNVSVVESRATTLTYYYVINGTTNTTIIDGNSTLNASDGYYNLTVFVSDGLQNGSDAVYFRLDTFAPSWSGNETNATLMKINGNATFNITISDYGSGLSYYIFSWNGTGLWDNSSNGTISGSSVKLVINKSTNLSQGNAIGYVWYANDSANNWNKSILRTFRVANTAPATPTIHYPLDGKNYTDIPYINYSSTDADSDTITYQIYINNTLNISLTTNLTDWNASDGFYNLTITSNDGIDSSDNSSVIHFRLDSTAPAFSNQEKNETPAINEDIRMNAIITEANCHYYRFFWNNSGTLTNDSAIACTAGVVSTTKTVTTAHQRICWGYWANDTAGNSASSNLDCFSVENTVATTPTVLYPTNGIVSKDVLLDINFTSTDMDDDTITYKVYINGTLNISTTTNITDWNASTGYYKLEVSAWDGMNSSANSSAIYFTYDITTPITHPNIISVADYDNDGNVEINWTDDAIEREETYRIYRSRSNITSINSSVINITSGIAEGTQFFEDNTTANGTIYWYVLVTVNTEGNYNDSIFSNSLNGTANDTIKPKTATNLNVTGSGATATLRWSNVTEDINGNSDFYNLQYVIYYGTNFNSSKALANESIASYSTTTASTNSTTISVTSSGTYHFVVTVLDDGGNKNLTLDLANNYGNASLPYTAPSSGGGGGGGGGGAGGGGAGGGPAVIPKEATSLQKEVLELKNEVGTALSYLYDVSKMKEITDSSAKKLTDYIKKDKEQISLLESLYPNLNVLGKVGLSEDIINEAKAELVDIENEIKKLELEATETRKVILLRNLVLQYYNALGKIPEVGLILDDASDIKLTENDIADVQKLALNEEVKAKINSIADSLLKDGITIKRTLQSYEIINSEVNTFSSFKSFVILDLKSEKEFENLEVMEFIPKSIVKDISNVIFNTTPIILQSDPVVEWMFGKFDKEVELKYSLDDKIDDSFVVLVFGKEKVSEKVELPRPREEKKKILELKWLKNYAWYLIVSILIVVLLVTAYSNRAKISRYVKTKAKERRIKKEEKEREKKRKKEEAKEIEQRKEHEKERKRKQKLEEKQRRNAEKLRKREERKRLKELGKRRKLRELKKKQEVRERLKYEKKRQKLRREKKIRKLLSFKNLFKPKPKEKKKIEEKKEELEDVKKEWKSLPKLPGDRVKLEIAIAKKIVEEKKSFCVSDIMKEIDKLYSNQITKKDRIDIYDDITEWVKREEICQKAEKKGDIQYYKFT